MSFALPRTLTAGLEQALQWLDVLLVGVLAGNAASGIYGGAIRFIQAGLVVDTALRVVVSPQFSKLLHQRKMEELASLYSTASVWLVLFATPVYVLMAVFSPALMRILGEGFEAGAGVLVALCAGSVVTFMAGNIHSLLIMSGRSGWAAVNKVVVLGLNVVGNVVFIPRFGMLAAAVVWAVCMVVDAALHRGAARPGRGRPAGGGRARVRGGPRGRGGARGGARQPGGPRGGVRGRGAGLPRAVLGGALAVAPGGPGGLRPREEERRIGPLPSCNIFRCPGPDQPVDHRVICV